MMHKYPAASIVLLTIFVSAITTGAIFISLVLKHSGDDGRMAMSGSFCSVPVGAGGRALAYPGEAYKEWKTHTSPAGFSFQYPPEYTVGEGDWPEGGLGAKSLTISWEDVVTHPGPPTMLLNVRAPSDARFSLWEGISWEHFEDVVHSFRFDPDAPSLPPGPGSIQS